MLIPIPILIPVGYTYSCTVSGTTFKIVQCEHCRFVYVYKMERTAAGVALDSYANPNPYSPQQAEAAATFDLRQKLREDCDAVPCLECGKYQEHMIEAMRRDFRLTLWYAGWITVGAGIVSLFFAIATLLYDMRSYEISWVLAGSAAVLAGIGASTLWWRRRELARFNPNNDDLVERMKLAARYAKNLEEFRAYLKYHGIEWNLPPMPDENAATATPQAPHLGGAERSSEAFRSEASQ